MNPFQLIKNALLCTSLALPALSMQTFVAEVDHPFGADEILARSELGRIALVRMEDVTRCSVNILTATAGNLTDFALEPTGVWSMNISDALFLNETTIVLGGSVNQRPYIAAYNINTGLPVWEKSLTHKGSILQLSINSIGKVIGVGRTQENFTSTAKALVCAISPTSGGWSWFRAYHPDQNTSAGQCVVPDPAGGMYLLVLTSPGVLVITHMTDWGHEISTKKYSMPSGNLSEVKACLAADGSLVISALSHESGVLKIALARMAPDGHVEWAKRLSFGLGFRHDVHSIEATPHGGVVLGTDIRVSSTSTSSAPVLAQINAEGSVEWAHSLATSGSVSHLKGLVLPDGGFLTSSTTSFGTRIVQTDALGFVGTCTGYAVPSTATDFQLIEEDYSYTYQAYEGAIGSLISNPLFATSSAAVVCTSSDTIGTTFCDPAELNSTGQSTRIVGSFSSGSGTGFHLEALQGPQGQFGYFMIGTGANEPGLVIDQGRFCLAASGGNQFARYNVAGGVWNSIGQFNASGRLENLTGTSNTAFGFDVPTQIPSLGVNIVSGETWHFQLWHREAAGHSNLSNGLSVDF